MGGALTADCGAPAGQELATRVGCQLAITPSFLIPFSHHTTHSSFGGGWPQKRSLAPLGNYKGNGEQGMRGKGCGCTQSSDLTRAKSQQSTEDVQGRPPRAKGL